MRTIFGCVAVLGMACGVAAADEGVNLGKLLGKWEFVDAKKGYGMTLEFMANKKVSVAVGEPGKEYKKIEGTYEVSDNNRLSVALRLNDEDIKESLTIKKLTDDELVTEDSMGKTGAMKRKK